MKSLLMKFANNVLSKNEMKALKGGYPYNQATVYCGFSIYYGNGFTTTGFGPCSCGNVSDCNQVFQGQLKHNRPGAVDVKVFGCWSGRSS